MRTMTELFNGGVVTSRVGALLNPGELQRADDCVYRDIDPSIWRAPGRTALLSSALGTDVRGIGHFSFDSIYTDQFVMLARSTTGSKTWESGEDNTFPAYHLYGCDFTAVTGLAPTEIGGQSYWTGTVTSTTMEMSFTVTNCTGSGTTLTTSSAFTNIKVGMVVSGTGITAGTVVTALNSSTSVTLSAASTSSNVTLTFLQYPFLSTAVGARLIGTSLGTGVYITAVSNQDGTTGRYRTATLSKAPSGGNGVYSFSITWGGVYDFNNSGNEILDFVQYGARRYYLWDGIGGLHCAEWKSRANTSNANLASILSLRPVGLKPVEKGFTLTVQTGQSTGWNAVKGTGNYWFLITEIFSPDSDIAAALKDPIKRSQIVESAYLGTNPSTSGDTGSQGGAGLPISATITTVASENILVTFPAVTNDGQDGFVATHWGIYIYGPSTDLPSLAQMRRCATVPITQMTAGATFTLTDSSLTQFQYAAGTRAVTGFSQFVNPSYLTGAPDGARVGTKIGGSSKPITENAAQGLTYGGFSTSGSYSGKAIYGVEIFIQGRANPSGDTTNTARYWFRIMTSTGKTSDTYYGEFGSKDDHINHHGGPMDTFGVAWASTDPPLMEVEIGIANRGAKDELNLNSVGLKIYYTTANVDFNGPAYRVVTYRDQIGLTVSDPARLRPPACSTGDFFSGSLVLNNLAQENQIRFSLPGDIEAWPKPYELTFNTRKRDKVTFIRTLNSVLIVGMENTIKRVNYLPRETSTDLTDGLVHEDIATDHGIPGPFCAARFDMPGKGVVIAYASTVGMFITNGIWTIPLNVDINWNSTVKVSALATSILRVYPKEKWLAFHYCPAGASHNMNTRVMYFCYQADKLKGDYQMPMIGPSVCSARSACEAYLNGVPYIFTGHQSDGNVYVEDSGLTVPTGYRARLNDDSANGDGKAAANTDVKILPIIRTRKFYPITLDRDGFGEKLYLMFSAFGSNSITAASDLTVGSTTVTSADLFASVEIGMRVLGNGVDPGTIVVSKDDDATIVLSRAANATVTGATLTFDTGTLGITARGSGLGEAVKGLGTTYVSTLVGDLVSTINSNYRRGFELQIEKVPVTFDSNGDTLTWADLHTNMRLHTLTYVTSESGFPDTSRNSN